MTQQPIRMYGSLEEMWSEMATATDQANRDLADAQRETTWGSAWVRFYNVQQRVIIFGRCLTRDEMALGEDPETIDHMIEQHRRGYLFSWCYSILEVAGELGDTHRANLWPIDEGLFEAARAVDWDIDRLGSGAALSLTEAYRGFRTHQKAIRGRNGR